jgi:hypothetical protein
MITRFLMTVVLAAAYCSIAFAANVRSEAAGYRTWQTKSAKILVARGDSRSLATAAALEFAGAGVKVKAAKAGVAALDFAARASELAPQDAGIAWIRLSLCTDSLNCDIRDAATAMRWVDAENAAAWLPTLAAAQKDRDSTEIDRVIGDMAQGQHFDLHLNRIVVLMFDALDAARRQLPGGYASTDSARYLAAAALANNEMIPAFAPLTEACRETGATAERREACLKLSRTMQRGDTLVAQLIGFSIERRFVAPDGKEARNIVERRRVLEWRASTSGKFDSSLLPWTKNSRARARIALMRSLPREEDVCIAILREHKISTDPPEPHT